MRFVLNIFGILVFAFLSNSVAVAQENFPPEFFPHVRRSLTNPIPEDAVTRFNDLLEGRWKMSCFSYNNGANYELIMNYENGILTQTFYIFAADDTQCAGSNESTSSTWRYFLFAPQNNYVASEPYNAFNPPTAWSVYLELIAGGQHDPQQYWDLVKIEGGFLTLSAETGAQTIPQSYYNRSFTKE